MKNRLKYRFFVVKSPDTVLVAVTPSACPSYAALAMATTEVTLGVNLAKKGIVTAALTHRQIFRTNSGSYE